MMTAIEKAPRRDYFSLLTVLAFIVTVDAALAIYHLWTALWSSRYAPLPAVILFAIAAAIPYYWAKVLRDRAAIREWENAAQAAVAVRTLYSGLFMTSVVCVLLLAVLQQITTCSGS